jgi:histidinol dehydrogenase
MAVRLEQSDPDFEKRFGAMLSAKREASEDVDAVVSTIVADVRARGDAALIEYTTKFDRVTPALEKLRFTESELAGAEAGVSAEVRTALALARDRIEAYHRKQVPEDSSRVDPIGVELGWRWSALESVGLYVPGGTAAYPSSVLMNAVPAKVAGVDRLVMCVPTPDGKINPAVLVAAKLAGVHEVYCVGGAQAIAALAYGTESIRPVAKIVGPGNAYVAAAKRQVFGMVGIDLIAGPSEVLIIADSRANPAWIAADLLAQAEHDPSSQAILITDSEPLADAVEDAVESQLKTLPRKMTAGASWRDFGAIIIASSLDSGAEIANRIAAEHVEVMVATPDRILPAIRNAGAIFIGNYTPEAVGDYIAGSNHVLPTARSARFSSGLSVLDFMKRTSILKCGPEQLNKLGPAAMTLAEAEGLEAHRRSVAIRLNI